MLIFFVAQCSLSLLKLLMREGEEGLQRLVVELQPTLVQGPDVPPPAAEGLGGLGFRLPKQRSGDDMQGLLSLLGDKRFILKKLSAGQVSDYNPNPRNRIPPHRIPCFFGGKARDGAEAGGPGVHLNEEKRLDRYGRAPRCPQHRQSHLAREGRGLTGNMLD